MLHESHGRSHVARQRGAMPAMWTYAIRCSTMSCKVEGVCDTPLRQSDTIRLLIFDEGVCDTPLRRAVRCRSRRRGRSMRAYAIRPYAKVRYGADFRRRGEALGQGRMQYASRQAIALHHLDDPASNTYSRPEMTHWVISNATVASPFDALEYNAVRCSSMRAYAIRPYAMRYGAIRRFSMRAYAIR